MMTEPTALEIELATRFSIVKLTPIHVAYIHETKNVPMGAHWMLGRDAIFRDMKFIGMAQDYPETVKAIQSATPWLEEQQVKRERALEDRRKAATEYLAARGAKKGERKKGDS